jgi:hypothetical protein
MMAVELQNEKRWNNQQDRKASKWWKLTLRHVFWFLTKGSVRLTLLT